MRSGDKLVSKIKKKMMMMNSTIQKKNRQKTLFSVFHIIFNHVVAIAGVLAEFCVVLLEGFITSCLVGLIKVPFKCFELFMVTFDVGQKIEKN